MRTAHIMGALALTMSICRPVAAQPDIVRLLCHFPSPEGEKEMTLSIDMKSKTVDSTPPAPVRIEDSLFTWSNGTLNFIINRYTGKFTFGPQSNPDLFVGSCRKASQIY
ncbi:hypothetical protein [Burkholderia multivorans]|uniref:hypothetical protein n=1 Tax=Burkholderia multivorans TaxID=87883 RepID=UPI001C2178DA|nr:hypothetical protein [Burkholderia multivorans]ULR75088.1 hypothetical protein JC1_16 [Burkholderia phage JC1]MBU9386603.1 hypothetical protein [Burkholderia multivorans]MBU9437037.1 hypothetical protein [Burkholderia multivorans]MBU9606243.1 hypothetical protein [Burkholderia multivorans]MBU9624802.1 hypothetical protein [Burkholderia multivorans]